MATNSLKRLVVTKKLFKFRNCLSSRRFSSQNDENIITCDRPDVEIERCTIQDFVFKHISIWGHHVATECAVTGRKYTFSELQKRANRFGKALRKHLKLNQGDVLAVLLPNVPEFPIITLGAFEAGVIITTINPIYTPDEIARQLTDSSAKAIITLGDFVRLAQGASQVAKQNLPVITIKSTPDSATPANCADFVELTDNDYDLPDLKDLNTEDIAILPYSSGTTGLPKGVKLSHFNIVSNLVQLENNDLHKFATATSHETTPAILPLFHIYGFTINCMHFLRLGTKLVTVPKFTPELAISILSKYKPEVMCVAPPLAVFLYGHPGVKSEWLANLRILLSGAAALTARDQQLLQHKIQKPFILAQGYGMTETAPLTLSTGPSLDPVKAAGSVGLPVRNTLAKIADINNPSGPALGPNQLGELLIKGPQVMKEYLNRPEETEKIFVDGWLRTGDVVYRSDDGYIFIADRLKELIKVKGFQVPPAELEEVIKDFSNVAEAAVIGIPHERHGEVPRAYVVPKPGAKIDVEKLQEFVNSKVAPYKHIVGGVSIVDSIPKNATGKVLRKDLREQYLQEK